MLIGISVIMFIVSCIMNFFAENENNEASAKEARITLLASFAMFIASIITSCLF